MNEPFDRPFDYSIYGDSLLQAVKDVDFEKVQRLLDAGTNVNYVFNGERPLILAARLEPKLLFIKGHTKPLDGMRIVKELIRRRADLNATDGDGNTAVFRATTMGNYAILKVLLDAGANPNAGRIAPITEAMNNPKEIALFLSKGADINCVGMMGTTFLDEVIRVGTPEVIKIVYDHAISTGNTAAALRLRRELTWDRRSRAIAAFSSIRGGRRRKTKRVQRRAHKSRRNK